MGHIFTATVMKPGPAKVEDITKLPPPKTVIKVRIFLDIIDYVLKFIAGCGKIIAPLMKILNYKRHFHWLPARDAALKILKTALILDMVLNFLNCEVQ